ncbi:MAG TPA: type II toxin-antitoxin system VapC family toxin [Pirellulaceae bacterium]|jgi:predicted nucleic acid-binding protein|nr:type II toxin-antitoxin system VapC family toxin [Pirellulaceae bacterium]
MKFVLDASVALKWALREDGFERAAKLRTAIRQGLHEALAPDIFPVEVAHALLKAERRKLIKTSETSDLLARVLSVPFQLRASEPLLFDALALASRSRLSVYDGLYVALAQSEKCDLVTADERLLRALPDAPIRLLSSLSE